MNLTITRLNGTTYSLADYGIRTLDFVVDSPSPRHETETIEGADGFYDLGTTYDGRTARGSFMMYAVDNADFPLLRNEIFRMFASKEAFYLVDDREPGKRWLFKAASSYSVEQMRRLGRFEVEFISAKAYAESVSSTLTPFTFEDSMWQIGQGLIDAEDLKYKHSTNSFRIYNAGAVKVDPRQMALVITYKGASTNLRIKNNTTLDEWRYTGSTGSTETLAIDGVRSLKNGVVSVFANTNRKLITLAPGWNDFVLTGTSGSFEIEFDFRFLYL